MKAYITTLGCPKNLVDSEAAATLLRRHGCTLTDDPAGADILMVNACSFLDASWQETLEEVDRLAAFKALGNGRRLILMGCLPLHRGENLVAQLTEVDHFLPTGAQGKLPDLLAAWERGRPVARTLDTPVIDRFAGYARRDLMTPAHAAYVKVAEGCNRACTFCAIPLIRGRQTCRPMAHIIGEVEELVARGVREITLLSQDIVSYRDGGAAGKDGRLAGLLRGIVATGIDWIRIFYLHPAGIRRDDIRSLFEHEAVCHYLEMPVQHASSRLLVEMKRGYDRGHVESLVAGVRRDFPDVVIRSEVIVGFPGETDAEFEDLKVFVEEMAFDSLGIFPYSPEPGTPAASMGSAVPEGEIRRRVEELAGIQEAISYASRTRFDGSIVPVLVDRRLESEEGVFDGCSFAGRFYGQAPDIDGEVYIKGGGAVIGEFCDVKITGTAMFDLEGIAVGSHNTPAVEDK